MKAEAESSSNSNHQSPPPEARPWAQVVVRRESQPDTNTSSSPFPSAMKESHSGSTSKAAPPSHSGSSPKAAPPVPSGSSPKASTPLAPPALDNNHAAAGGSGSNCKSLGGYSGKNRNNVGGSFKKQNGKRPSNGVLDVNPLEGVSWPDLSEAAKPKPKSFVQSSSRIVSNGSASTSTSQGPINPNHYQKNRATSGTAARNRNPRRSGNGGSSSSGGVSIQGEIRPPPTLSPLPPPPPPPPPFPVGQGQRPHRPLFSGHRPILQDNHSLGVFNPQPRMMNGFEHPPRIGSYGRGNGAFQSNFENGRDARMQPRGLMGPPPPPFLLQPSLSPPPFPPYMRPNNFVYHTGPVDPYGGVPYIAQPQPMYMHHLVPNICDHLIRQIEYYFSDDNLVKDGFLKGNMDHQGWVPVSLIAGFPKVQKMTCDIGLILYSLGFSSIVEIQDDKLRRRDEWMKWVSSSSRVSSDSGSSSQADSSSANLAASLHNTTLEDKAVSPPQEEPSSGPSS